MSLNQVTLIGRLGADSEFKQFQNGCIANIQLATSERAYTLQNGTQIPEHTDWHTVVFRGRLAEVARDYCKKGTMICVTGKIRYREYETQGEKKYVTEIWAGTLELLSSPKNDGQPTSPASQPATPPQSAPLPEGGMDDLPF